MNERLSRLLREPLFHFFILGLAIYGGYAWLYAGETSEGHQQIIRVGEGERAWMRTSFEKRWKREPTPRELEGLTTEYVRETAFYREALAMGLDKDDTIVRRRLAQKLEFLVQDLLDVSPPTDADLATYFEAHRGDYRRPDLITFTHVFVDPDKRDAATHDDAMKIRAALEKLEDPASGAKELGDPFMLQSYYPERTEADISKLFGGEFAETLAASNTGAWHGPIVSGYGLHLVYVHGKQTFPQPELSEVRERLAEDWATAKRAELNEEYRKRLLEKYTIVIEDVPTSNAVAQGEPSQ